MRWLKMICFAWSFICSANGSVSFMSFEPSVTYLDGLNHWDRCNPYIGRTITGKSGVIFSHTNYGTMPYNSSKNCIIMIVVPVGYQLKIKILDFNVPGNSGVCDKDSLHVLDHLITIDPTQLSQTAHIQRDPGPLIGNLCGQMSNINQTTIVSTHNAMTLWWHADNNVTGRTEESGFRILWTAFRIPSKNDLCHADDEFRCGSSECIPSSLACNQYADCEDSSDTNRQRQIMNNCKNIANDLLSTLDGPHKLLVCLAIVFVVILAMCLIGSLIYCLCGCFNKKQNKHNSALPVDGEHTLMGSPPFVTLNNGPYMAYPPVTNYYPSKHPVYPSPHGNPPDEVTNTTTTVTKSSSNQPQVMNNVYQPLVMNPSMTKYAYQMLDTCGNSYIVPPPPATPAYSDYTYIRTDVNNRLVI